MGARIDGCGLAEVWGQEQSVLRKRKEEGEEAAGVRAAVRQALPAVTGLSQVGGGGNTANGTMRTDKRQA